MATNYRYIVQAGQNIYDVALQEYGDIGEGVFALLEGNGLEFATVLEAGQELILDLDKVVNKDVKAYYSYKRKIVATGEGPTVVKLIGQGIKAISSNGLVFKL